MALRYFAWLTAIILVAILRQADAATVQIPCCSNPQTIINANPTAGTVFQFAAGVYHQPTVFPSAINQTFIGSSTLSTLDNTGTPTGGTIFNGDATQGDVNNGNYLVPSGMIVQNITITNFAVGSSDCAQSAWNSGPSTSWIDVTFTQNNCTGLGIAAVPGMNPDGVTVTRGRYVYNKHSGISATNNAIGGAHANNIVISGAEIGHNNTRGDPLGNDVAGAKFCDGVNNAQFFNNWVHDNAATGIWSDCGNTGWVIDSNTVVRNSSTGIFYETSVTGIIRNNVVNDNLGAAIYIDSGNAQVTGNNIRQQSGTNQSNAFLLQATARSDAQTIANSIATGNTVTFKAACAGNFGGCLWGVWNQTGDSEAGINFSNNHFFAASASDPHWTWDNGATGVAFATYQSLNGSHDTTASGSSVTAGDGSVTGCEAIGGTGNPTTSGCGTGGGLHTASPSGTCITQSGPSCTLPAPGGIITDSLGNDYQLVNLGGANGFGIQVNLAPSYTGFVADPCGAPVPGTPCTDHVIFLLTQNGSMYQETSVSNQWFIRTGSPTSVNWTATSSPITPPGVPPPPPAWTGTQRLLGGATGLLNIFRSNQNGSINSQAMRDFNVSAYDTTPVTVNALGTVQGDAFQLTEQFNIVTGGSTNSGVIAQQGHTLIWNMTGNTIMVYPMANAALTYVTTSVGTPTTLAVNVGVPLPAGSIIEVNMTSGTAGYARIW